jgi:hypothetical protein
MDKRTKYYRVKQLSPYGGYHRTFDALWAAIPPVCKDQCTVKALVTLVNALKHQREDGAHSARTMAVADGVLYHRANKYRLVEDTTYAASA